MISNISARNPRRKVERVAFGALVLLTMLVLVAALAGSGSIGISVSSAQAQLSKPTTADKGKVATPATGDRIAIAAIRDNQGLPDIYTMDPNGNDVMRLTSNPGNYTPAWSPDGSQIAFYGNHTGATGVYIMTANGGNQHMIGPQGASDPTWSPDGTKIAFRSQDNEIYVMNSDGTGTPTPLTTDNTVNLWPSWSPDGTKIAFVNVLRDGDPDDEIYVMNSNGSNQHVIDNPPSGSGDASPAWSPDGSRIAFVSGDSAGLSAVYAMDATGGNISQVTAVLYGQGSPTWSPDGLRIAFQRTEALATDPTLNPTGGTNHIYVIDVTGANEHGISGSSCCDYYPDWQHNAAKVVLVQGEDGTPIEGAQVYNECALMGTTDISGTLVLTSPLTLDDRLIARKQVHEEPTQKGGHDGWAYHVWLTNMIEENDGSETVFVVTDTNQLTQTLVISSTNVQIGFNIVASVGYNDTAAHLDEIKQGFDGANEFLMDVTDGQMYFEQVKLYDDGQNFDDADFQFQLSDPRSNADAHPDGISALVSPCCHIRMASPDHYGVPYTQQSAYSVLIHEFGHYAIGADDEYYKFNTDDYPTQCTADFPSGDYEERASIMYHQEESSEFCATVPPIVHNPDTAQGYIQGESVWETLVDNYSDEQGLWQLRSPITRGVVDPGPTFAFCRNAYGAQMVTFDAPGPSCSRSVQVHVELPNHDPAVTAYVTLQHGSSNSVQPVADRDGDSFMVGVSTGDTIYTGVQIAGVDYTGSAVVANCTDLITIVMHPLQAPSLSLERPYAWPTYWLEAVPDWTSHQITATLHLEGDPPAQPTLYASQDTLNRQQLILTYNSSLQQYVGTYIFTPTLSPDFRFELQLPTGSGVAVSSYSFTGGQFHPTGPVGYEKMKNLGVPHGNNPKVPPVAWNILRPESEADVIVNPSSLPDGTGVMVGESGLPADRPANLIPVGGPYSVQGQNPISGVVGITLGYQSEYFCGLVPGSASIYMYTGSEWAAIPTNLIEAWHQAGGKITQWGIYGVFAQPNPQVVFSDVPSGSTFYNYINWITCHGVASGYTDGTFRPNNNATRGQISKMVALAFRWRLEAPSGGNYTFTDVQPGSTFFLYIEAAYREGVVSGYPCGGAGEPCDAQQRPYFRPNNNVTRAQIAKIVSNAARYTDTPTGQTFEDVLAGSTFYDYIERIASRGIINGYPCGGAGEPCGPNNLPYFRPNNNATRGQLSKIIYLTLQPR